MEFSMTYISEEDVDYIILAHRMGFHPAVEYHIKYLGNEAPVEDDCPDSVFPAIVFLHLLKIPACKIDELYAAEEDEELAEIFYMQTTNELAKTYLRMKWGFDGN